MSLLRTVVLDLIMHTTHVHSKVWTQGKESPTQGTLVRLLTRMCQHMILQVNFTREPGRAKVAHVWLLRHVPFQVPLQRSSLVEGLATLRAVVHLYPTRMQPGVFVQSCLPAEFRWAHLARKRRLTLMHEHVSHEVGPASKVAAADRTGVRLLPRVDTRVLDEMRPLSKILLTDETDVGLLALVFELVSDEAWQPSKPSEADGTDVQVLVLGDTLVSNQVRLPNKALAAEGAGLLLRTCLHNLMLSRSVLVRKALSTHVTLKAAANSDRRLFW